jgi:hypothetical protein
MIIWLASYPKSGNTWLRLFLRSYFLSNDINFSINTLGNTDYEAKTFPNLYDLKKYNVDYTKFENIVKNWIPLQEYINLNNKVNLLKTHNGNFTINNFPFTNTDNTIGVIYIVRDPRDVVLSMSNHFNVNHKNVVKLITNVHHYELNEEERNPNLKDGFKSSILGSWSYNYLSWKSYKGRKVHLVRYEDLSKNPFKYFTEILEYLTNFINFKIDENKVRKAINETSLQNLKKMESNIGFSEKSREAEFFRKGKVGEWKKSLDRKLVKEIEEKFCNEMKELKYF